MPIPSVTSPAPLEMARDPRLGTAVRQLQGVFVEQLFKAMRETVPDDGMLGGSAGESMFTGLMDQQLADMVPGQWSDSLGEALLRQFRDVGPMDTREGA